MFWHDNGRLDHGRGGHPSFGTPALWLALALAIALGAPGPSRAPAAAPPSGTLVTYQQVLTLVQTGVPEDVILELLKKSPTNFVLDATQVQQLKDAGASDKLIDALQRKRRSKPRGKPAQADQEADVTDIALILDCSGSMKEHTTDGDAKMTVAKRVVSDLIQKVPNGLGLTFVAYGHDKELACKAVQVVRPLSDLDGQGKSDLTGLIGRLNPVGQTPIALALRTAGKELAKSDGSCGLVLISDGKENCKGKPAAEAAKLARDLKLAFGARVIGFDVDADGRRQLQQIVSEVGGQSEYYDARTTQELSAAISKLRQDIERVFEPPAIQIIEGPIAGIKVMPLTLEGFPEIKSVFVVNAGDAIHRALALQESEKPGQLMPVKPATYDIGYVPSKSETVALVTDVEVKSHQVVTLNPNRLVSAITVRDPKIEGLKAQGLYVVRAGDPPHRALELQPCLR